MLLSDVDTLEGWKQLGVHSKRLAAFMLQDDYSPTQDTYDCTQEEQTRMLEREKLRPDIILEELTDIEGEAYMTGEKMPPSKRSYAKQWTEKCLDQRGRTLHRHPI